ncbi:hypothetical protein [Streptosporangium sp. CA-115845]|uniref:hypothetical protein n=1 Tax=Streptosporangium sp. CA-115845 TaxID=3240071 RepID=UPI003D90AC6F
MSSMMAQHLRHPDVQEKATAARFAGQLLNHGGLDLTAGEFLTFRAYQLLILRPHPFWAEPEKSPWESLPSWQRALRMGGYPPNDPERDAETSRLGALYTRCIHDVLLRQATRYLVEWVRHPESCRESPERVARLAQHTQRLLFGDVDMLSAVADLFGCGARDRRWLHATLSFTPASGHRLQGPMSDRDLTDYFITKLFRRTKSSFTEFTAAWPVFSELLAAVGALECDRSYLRDLLTDLGVSITPEIRDQRRFRLNGMTLRPPAERAQVLDDLFDRYAPTVWTKTGTVALAVWALRREGHDDAHVNGRENSPFLQ